MESRIEKLEEEVREIQERNARVEGDKAWETSWFRIALVMFVTYAIAAAVLHVIGNDNPLRNALIPTLGYFLSTLSLGPVKKAWIQGYLNRK